MRWATPLGWATRAAMAVVLTLLAAVAFATGASALPLAHCQHRIVTILGTSGADMIVGTPARDIIAAWGGDDLIRGRGGDDIICAGSGDDLVKGGPGRDQVTGASGGDELRGNEGNDNLNAQAGDDTVRGNKGNDVVRGGRRDAGDVAYGGPGYDICGARMAFHSCEAHYGGGG
jgi:Ca2+-binding RTX toxin-like protein